MGEAGPPGQGDRQGAEGAVLPGQPDLLLQPVRQEGPELPLRVGVPPVEETLPRGGGHEQVGALRLLGGGEEPRVGGNAPLLGPLLLVQDAGQEEAALPIPGESIQQVGFVHGVPSSLPWGWGTVLGGFWRASPFAVKG